MKLKKTLSAVTACALSFTMAFAFTACDDSAGKDEEAVITAIALSEAEQIEAGTTANVISSITYSDGTTKKLSDSSVEWTTSNSAVATVNRGIVSALTAGETKITATSGSVTSNECTVTVIAGRVVSILDSTGNPITSLTLDKGDNPTAQLSAKVTRDGVEVKDQEIVWASANTEKVIVDATGKVTAVMDTEKDTPVTITATIKDTSFKAELPVTVNWTEKENFTFDASTYEQNKSPAGIWNYWGDKNYNWTNTTIFSAYVDPTYETGRTPQENYQYIGANKVTIEYNVDNPTVNDAAVQLFYRSAGDAEEAKLLTNHNYEVTLKLETNTDGVVSLNDYRNLPPNPKEGVEIGEIAGGADDDDKYLKEVKAGEVNTLTVQFRHGDTGAIYKNGIYDNVESAIQLCIGKLAGEHVVLSVYDIQYRDLGEAEKKWEDNETNIEGYVKPIVVPDMGNAEAVALEIINDDEHKSQVQAGSDVGTYTVDTTDSGKSYTIGYTTKSSTYEYFSVALENINGVADCNTFAVTVKNNGSNTVAIRFDLNGPIKTNDPNGNPAIVDCVTGEGIATEGSIAWDSQWGGTVLTLEAGKTATLYLTYSTAVHGTPEELAIYCNTQWYGNAESNWQEIREERTGNITLSGFTFAKVNND